MYLKGKTNYFYMKILKPKVTLGLKIVLIKSLDLNRVSYQM